MSCLYKVSDQLGRVLALGNRFETLNFVTCLSCGDSAKVSKGSETSELVVIAPNALLYSALQHEMRKYDADRMAQKRVFARVQNGHERAWDTLGS